MTGMRSVARVPITMLTVGACRKSLRLPVGPRNPLLRPADFVCLVALHALHQCACKLFVPLARAPNRCSAAPRPRRRRIAQGRSRLSQTSGCTLSVSDIHLAAKSFDVDLGFILQITIEVQTVYQKSFRETR